MGATEKSSRGCHGRRLEQRGRKDGRESQAVKKQEREPSSALGEIRDGRCFVLDGAAFPASASVTRARARPHPTKSRK